MKDYVQRAISMFEACSLRERGLILLVLLAATWGGWINSVGGYVIDSKAQVISSIDVLAQNLREQNTERERLKLLDFVPEYAALHKQQQRLNKNVILQTAELESLLAYFVAPKDIPVMLEDVLRNHQGLKLIRLESQPTQRIEVVASQETESLRVPAIYRHPVQMEFEGGYLDVIAYLNTLEQGEWHFSWRRLEYVVDEYPRAQVLIEIETLSESKEWLGV